MKKRVKLRSMTTKEIYPEHALSFAVGIDVGVDENQSGWGIDLNGAKSFSDIKQLEGIEIDDRNLILDFAKHDLKDIRGIDRYVKECSELRLYGNPITSGFLSVFLIEYCMKVVFVTPNQLENIWMQEILQNENAEISEDGCYHVSMSDEASITIPIQATTVERTRKLIRAETIIRKHLTLLSLATALTGRVNREAIILEVQNELIDAGLEEFASV